MKRECLVFCIFLVSFDEFILFFLEIGIDIFIVIESGRESCF